MHCYCKDSSSNYEYDYEKQNSKSPISYNNFDIITPTNISSPFNLLVVHIINDLIYSKQKYFLILVTNNKTIKFACPFFVFIRDSSLQSLHHLRSPTFGYYFGILIYCIFTMVSLSNILFGLSIGYRIIFLFFVK